MTRVRPAGSSAKRVDRDRRAFELALAGNTNRRVAEIMKEEGYLRISATTAGKLIKDYGATLVIPLAQEHITREFERLMAQRLRLDEQRDRAWEICNRFHFATNNAGVIMIVEPGVKGPDGKPVFRPIRDSGPELQALTVMQGIEKLVLANADALAKLFGYRAPEESKVTVTTEVDKAVADLVGEMNARDAASARSVRA
jgi:hypothetical protein